MWVWWEEVRERLAALKGDLGAWFEETGLEPPQCLVQPFRGRRALEFDRDQNPDEADY